MDVPALWHAPARRLSRDYGRGMPTVSGATFALPAPAAAHAFACTAGNTAFCASAPANGANWAPRLVAYCFNAADLTIWSTQIFSTVAITSGGTPFGMKMPK